MKQLFLSLVLLVVAASTVVSQPTRTGSSNRISIGFIYCEFEELLRAEQIVSMLNKESSQKPVLIDLKTHKLSAEDNTLTMSLTVCDKLMGKTPLYSVLIARTDCLKVWYRFSKRFYVPV